MRTFINLLSILLGLALMVWGGGVEELSFILLGIPFLLGPILAWRLNKLSAALLWTGVGFGAGAAAAALPLLLRREPGVMVNSIAMIELLLAFLLAGVISPAQRKIEGGGLDRYN